MAWTVRPAPRSWLELVLLDRELRGEEGRDLTLADYQERHPEAKVLLDISTGVMDPLGRESPPDEGATVADSCGQDVTLGRVRRQRRRVGGAHGRPGRGDDEADGGGRR